jgi:hypothetical protein
MEDYGRKGDPRRRIVRVQRDIDEAKDACGG